MTEPARSIAVPRPAQDCGIRASQNPRIGRSIAQHHDLEAIRRKTAYDFFRCQILRVRVRFIRERGSEYRDHGNSGGFHLRVAIELLFDLGKGYQRSKRAALDTK